MAKFHGKVGFVTTVETAPGVYSEVVTEKNHFGDVIRNTRRWEKGEGLNDNIQVTNQFSIIGDSFMLKNMSSLRYIEYMGQKWKVTSIEIVRPRLILTIGGLYNAT